MEEEDEKSDTAKSVTIMERPEEHIISRGGQGDEETGSWSSDEEELSKRYERVKSQPNIKGGDLHMLASYQRGESKVETLAKKIENRIKSRVPVTFGARKTFLKECKNIAVAKNYSKKSVIEYSDIKEYYKNAKETYQSKRRGRIYPKLTRFLGYMSDEFCLYKMLQKANDIGEEVGMQDNDNFHYEDFNFFHTVLIGRYPWSRHELLKAFGIVFGFYLITIILFCDIMEDPGVCPRDSKKVPGWVTAIYFACTTQSTVGYGDFTVQKNETWKVAIGAIYMICSLLVSLLAFSAAAEKAISPVKSFVKSIAPFTLISYPEGPLKEGEYLYQRIRKVRWVALFDVMFQFIIMNAIGVFASQIFIGASDLEGERRWSWMDSIYWAIQTTTTIGYGDYQSTMPEYMQPFLIFYLTLGSYFTGSSLGRLKALREELAAIRRYHAFERREVNKHMMHYLSSTDDPNRVDQYEFVIAQLLNLRKIDATDIYPIMDKFRKLARGHNTGYIQVEDVPDESPGDDDDLSKVEGQEGT